MCSNTEDLKIIKDLYHKSRISLSDRIVNESFCNSVTINPDLCSELELFGHQIRKDNSVDEGEYHIINGNFFGPFRPDKYFESRYRILAILKEDYICKESFDNGDKGGHDKATEFSCPDDEDKVDTYDNVMKFVNKILGSLEFKNEQESEDDVFLDNTAIINVNPFPGLAKTNIVNGRKIRITRTDDGLLHRWVTMEENHVMLYRILNLLKPNLVLAGGTLRHFLSNGHLFADLKDLVESVDIGTVFDRKIMSGKVFSGKHHDFGIYTDETGTMWIDDCHPSFPKGGMVDIHASCLADAVADCIRK